LIRGLVNNQDFIDLVYVGAGRDTSKRCLPGTREDILSEIKDWIDSTGEDVERILWLSGTAGKGKSAIAHTISNWVDDRAGLGAHFCFDRTREAERRHEKIFATIARDLADRDPIIRRTLANVIRDDNELRHTKDIMRQWKNFILAPVDAASRAIDAPILMVIDGLDESGEPQSREHILRMLVAKADPFSTELTKFPAHFRVLVTSRPLDDIHRFLHDGQHVRHVSMDNISPASAERDIQHYVSTRLANLGDAFNDSDFQILAQKSDGMFEWARLACEYIKGSNRLSRSPRRNFNALVTGTSGNGIRLLDDMYRRTLAEIIPEDDHEEAMPLFRSVMGQILASREPLSKDALMAMRLHFVAAAQNYNVDDVIGPMSSLVTGTANSGVPIRPLHGSFYEFLTDESRSHRFFIDTSLVASDIALASLRVMEDGLRFNICSLESSYLPNDAITDLEKRVKNYIPDALSYSCRFWGAHVGATPAEALLVEEVKAFFDERLLLWMEALSLIKKAIGSAVQTLSFIKDWCQVCWLELLLRPIHSYR